MTEEISPRSQKTADSVFAGRIEILYALGRHYLSLPFAVLVCAGHPDRRPHAGRPAA